MAADYVLEMKDITKRYGENTVLSNVSLKVRPGEIHALLGENGAGKSTLMNVLFGMPVIHTTGGFEGEVFFNGEKTVITSPHDAMLKGIGMVHQEFMLLPGFNITENIKLNREITKPNAVSKALSRMGSRRIPAKLANFLNGTSESLETLDVDAMSNDARSALNSVGMSIDEYTMVNGLPVGYMQFVEIAREIDKTGVKLMVFDEPTAVLTESEAAQLLKVMKEIASKGIAIIFITHRLDEVMEAANSMTILRDGKLAATREIAKSSVVEIAELMIGRQGQGESVVKVEKREAPKGEIAMKVKDLYVAMPGEEVEGVSFDVYKGEILGIGGLAGQGKIGIPNGVMSLYPSEGSIELFGEALKLGNAGDALRSGIAMVSEDRKGVGLLLDQSIEDNIVFNAMQIKGEYLRTFGKGKLSFTTKDSKAIRDVANDMIKDLDIRCFGATQHAGTLSGGNQQKVCIARALAMDPKFLFVSEPTRGIDIGAKSLVLETLVKLNREQGMTIVMVSSELQELRSICDRIAIVSEGKVVDILAPDASDADFGLAMSGIKPDEHRSKGGQ